MNGQLLSLRCPEGEANMGRQVLSDKFIKALKPAKPDERYYEWDTLVPSFGVRVTDRGGKTLGVMKRIAGAKYPAWRAICEYAPLPDTEVKAAKNTYNALPVEERAKLSFDQYLLETYGASTLAPARERARKWLALIQAGLDPKELEAAQRKAAADKRLAAERERSATFSTVLEIFIAEKVHEKLRTENAVKRRLRNEVLPVWRNRSIHSITRDDVKDLILTIVQRPAPEYARSVLDDVRMLFAWAVDSVKADKPYRLGASPVAGIKPKVLIGAKTVGTRVLEDNEIRALWIATGNVGYPIGPMVRMLLLTGCRLDEVAGAKRGELNGDWVIPPERFKSGIQHRVPITDDLRSLLESLPQFKFGGDYLFSYCHGREPVNSFTNAKRKIDAFMPAEMPHWVFHDIRRTVRTAFEKLHVLPVVAELAIGHGKKGLEKVYAQYRHGPEIKNAFEGWHGMLRSIVNPQANVIPMRKRKRRR
jgi:integrase